ncbi:MAG TPA: radical SAM protein [Patescibacteria group bacterium]|nr:radical SAM protein [Patescibacteria group bacterium]
MNSIGAISVPSKIEGIYQDDVNGFLLVCNPLDMNGIHVLDNRTTKIFNLCCGLKSIAEISFQCEEDINYTSAVVNALYEKGIIRIGDTSIASFSKKHLKKQLDSWFHITNNCNLACKYCYINRTNESMSFETAKKAIDSLIASAVLYGKTSIRVKFAGGEPLLEFPLIKRIVSYARWAGDTKGVDFIFNIITNGTLISKDISEYIKSEEMSVSVSLDGIGEYHNCQRGGFSRVERGITVLQDNEVIPSILVTVSELSLMGLPALTEYLLDRGLPFRFSLFRELEVRNDSPIKSDDNFNHRVITTLHQCYDIIETMLPKKELPQFHKLCDIDITRKRMRNCGIGSNGVVVGHNGQIAICQALLDHPVGTVFSGDPLTLVRNQSEYKIGSYSVDKNTECNSCIWRYVCTGGCPLLTTLKNGSFSARSPFCEVFKEMIPRLLRIHGLQIINKNSK